MKRSMMNVMRSSMRPIAGLFLVALLFTACKKNDTDYGSQPAAGIMAFNLAPDKSAVGFSLSGNNLGNTALDYTSYTGVYLPIYIGNREVRSFDYNTGSTLAIANMDFADSTYYSAFLLGANGNYRNVVVKDDLIPLTVAPGKAWVRYINAIPDSTVTPVITLGENTSNAPYASVSPFMQVTAGAVSTSVTGGAVSATRTITMEENKVYTVMFMGIPNDPDPYKAVQIRFIPNGTVTP